MFKVMTWNLENLFRIGHASGPSTEAAYTQKLAGLAAVINAEVPDALAVQELGDPLALDDLTTQLTGTWNRQVSVHPDGRGIRVAWLSTRPISNPAKIIDFPAPLQPVQVDDDGTTLTQMGRGAVTVTVTTDSGTPVRLVTCHLKSKLLTFPAAGSTRTTKTNAPATPPTPSPGGPARPPPSASPSRRLSTGTATNML